MNNEDLEQYVKKAREGHHSEDSIRQELLKFGWAHHIIEEVMNPKPQSIGLPPPPVPQFGMWVSFQYILLFISLYVSFTSLGGILHSIVDKYIKDSLQDAANYYSYSAVSNDNWILKGYVAGILVTYPIFAFLFIILKRQLFKTPGVRSLRARKFLIYLTLVGTFLVMIGHLIVTIYGFLGGSTTFRALAHFGVTLLIAGSIFIYLLNEVREDRKA